MKHFANYIDIYPESVVSSISGTTITTSDGSTPDRIVAASDIGVTDNPGSSNAGLSFEQQSMVVTSEKLSALLRSKYGNRRPVVAVLYDDDGTPMVWGDKKEKLRVVISPNIENDVLDFSRQSVNPLL